MNTKHFTIFLLIFLLLTMITTCGKGDKADDDTGAQSAPAGQEPASVVEDDTNAPASSDEQPAPTEEPAAPVEEESAAPPAAETVSLDTLDSYRLEWGVTMQSSTDDSTMPLSNLVEWVREPFALHVVLGIGNVDATELIAVGDRVWAKMPGGDWMETDSTAAVDSFSNISETMELTDDGVFVGEETVDGIHCRHYVYDFQEMIHQEWWVADEEGVPPVVIQVLYRMTTSAMTTETNGRVYDINEPIIIEPPQ